MKGSQFCGQPCLPLADVYEVASSKTTVFIMYIQVSQWHPPLIWRVFCCRCCHCCCCSYAASPVHMFFATTIFRYLSTTIHDEASRCVASSVSRGPSELKKNLFRIEVLLPNTNGVNLNHPRWHPCPVPRLENILKKRKLSWTVTCMLSQLYRLLDFYGAAPHSWQEPVKPFLKIKPFLGLAGVELNATNNWVLTYDLNIYPEFVVLSHSL